MPYAAHGDWQAHHAEWYRARYRVDGEFRQVEAKRKATWYAMRASDPAWLAAQAAKKRLQRAAAKKKKTDTK
ncbi:MAG: hypothetical protein WCS65_12470 [Verrucomicrobiae bacterium]